MISRDAVCSALWGIVVGVASWLGLSVVAAAQSSTAPLRTIPTDPGFVTDTKWFDGAGCADHSKDSFYFFVGKQLFVAPPQTVVRGRLGRITKVSSAPGGQMVVQVPKATGCKTDPITFVEVELKGDSGKLTSVALAETPERSEPISPVGKYIQFLGKNGQCQKTTQADLVACGGSRTENGRNIKILFFVVVEGGNKVDVPSSGIPIHARCEDFGRGAVCRVDEELENNVTAKASIDSNGLSAEAIRQLRTQLVDFAKKLAAH
jgi:hypothetical protein